MDKTLLRIATFLLVPCLVADPVTAGAVGNAFSRPPQPVSRPLLLQPFEDQALTLPVVDAQYSILPYFAATKAAVFSAITSQVHALHPHLQTIGPAHRWLGVLLPVLGFFSVGELAGAFPGDKKRVRPIEPSSEGAVYMSEKEKIDHLNRLHHDLPEILTNLQIWLHPKVSSSLNKPGRENAKTQAAELAHQIVKVTNLLKIWRNRQIHPGRMHEPAYDDSDPEGLWVDLVASDTDEVYLEFERVISALERFGKEHPGLILEIDKEHDLSPSGQISAQIHSAKLLISSKPILTHQLDLNTWLPLRYFPRVQVIAEGPPHLTFISIDEAALYRVLLNLAKNASDAGAKQIKIRWRIDEVDQILYLSLEDDGRGMDPAFVEKVNALLSGNSEKGISTNGEGRGLGLSIIRGAVDDLHGEILAENNPGSGAVFTMSLPLQPAEESVARKVFAAAAGAGVSVVVPIASSEYMEDFRDPLLGPGLDRSKHYHVRKPGSPGASDDSAEPSLPKQFASYLKAHPHRRSTRWSYTRQWWIENRDELRRLSNRPQLTLNEFASILSEVKPLPYFFQSTGILRYGPILDYVLDSEKYFSARLEEALRELNPRAYTSTKSAKFIAALKEKLEKGKAGELPIVKSQRLRSLVQELTQVRYGKELIKKWWSQKEEFPPAALAPIAEKAPGSSIASSVQDAGELPAELKARAMTWDLRDLNRQLWVSFALGRPLAKEEVLAQLGRIRHILGFASLPPDTPITGAESQELQRGLEELTQAPAKTEVIKKRKEQKLLDARLSVQLALAEKLISSGQIAATLATLMGVYGGLQRKARRSKGQGFPDLPARNAFGESVPDVPRSGSHIIDIDGRVWARRWKQFKSLFITEDEKRTLPVPIWYSIEDPDAAQRSLDYTLDSEMELNRNVIVNIAKLDQAQLLLRRSPNDEEQFEVKTILQNARQWAHEGKEEGRAQAEIDLEKAVEALGKPDTNLAISLIETSKTLLKESRLTEIREIRTAVRKQRSRFRELRESHETFIASLRQTLGAIPSVLTEQINWWYRLNVALQQPVFHGPFREPVVSREQFNHALLMMNPARLALHHEAAVSLHFKRAAQEMQKAARWLEKSTGYIHTAMTLRAGAQVLMMNDLADLEVKLEGVIKGLKEKRGGKNLTNVLAKASLELNKPYLEQMQVSDYTRRKMAAKLILDRIWGMTQRQKIKTVIEKQLEEAILELKAAEVVSLDRAMDAVHKTEEFPKTLILSALEAIRQNVLRVLAGSTNPAATTVAIARSLTMAQALPDHAVVTVRGAKTPEGKDLQVSKAELMDLIKAGRVVENKGEWFALPQGGTDDSLKAAPPTTKEESSKAAELIMQASKDLVDSHYTLATKLHLVAKILSGELALDRLKGAPHHFRENEHNDELAKFAEFIIEYLTESPSCPTIPLNEVALILLRGHWPAIQKIMPLEVRNTVKQQIMEAAKILKASSAEAQAPDPSERIPHPSPGFLARLMEAEVYVNIETSKGTHYEGLLAPGTPTERRNRNQTTIPLFVRLDQGKGQPILQFQMGDIASVTPIVTPGHISDTEVDRQFSVTDLCRAIAEATGLPPHVVGEKLGDVFYPGPDNPDLVQMSALMKEIAGKYVTDDNAEEGRTNHEKSAGKLGPFLSVRDSEGREDGPVRYHDDERALEILFVNPQDQVQSILLERVERNRVWHFDSLHRKPIYAYKTEPWVPVVLRSQDVIQLRTPGIEKDEEDQFRTELERRHREARREQWERKKEDLRLAFGGKLPFSDEPPITPARPTPVTSAAPVLPLHNLVAGNSIMVFAEEVGKKESEIVDILIKGVGGESITPDDVNSDGSLPLAKSVSILLGSELADRIQNVTVEREHANPQTGRIEAISIIFKPHDSSPGRYWGVWLRGDGEFWTAKTGELIRRKWEEQAPSARDLVVKQINLLVRARIIAKPQSKPGPSRFEARQVRGAA